MINIDAKRPENANMEIWKIIFFTFYSWKNAKFLVKIAKKKNAKHDKYRRKTSRKCKYGNLRILLFTFYSWKNAKFLVKIIKKSLPNMINIDAKRLENANMEIWEILFFTFYSWKNAKFLVKIAKKKFAKHDKYRRKTSRKCKYGNLRNFTFHIFTLEKTQNSW